MQVSGGSQSFNAVNQLRVLGRWMRMITIPNQSSVAKAFHEFDEDGRMKPSAYYDRVVDVMEELVKFTLLTRDVAAYLVDRYSERRESAESCPSASTSARFELARQAGLSSHGRSTPEVGDCRARDGSESGVATLPYYLPAMPQCKVRT